MTGSNHQHWTKFDSAKIVLFFYLGLVGSSVAQTPNTMVFSRTMYGDVWAQGAIQTATDRDFRTFLEDNGKLGGEWPVKIYLSSQGGSVEASMRLGRLIRQHRMDIVVNGPCASACTYVAMGGVRRNLGSSGTVSVHQFTSSSHNSTIEAMAAAQRLSAQIDEYSEEMGIARGFLREASRTPNSTVVTLTVDQLVRFGFLNNETNNAPATTNRPLPAAPRTIEPQLAPRPAEVVVPPPLVPSTLSPARESPPETPLPQVTGPIPQFREFLVTRMFRGPNAPLRMTPEQRTYRTRLREAATERPNFAGRFVLTSWGCGTACATGAVYDAVTGNVVFFPFSICCARQEADNTQFRPIEFRANSALVVFAGLRNEREGDMAAHFYEFTGTAFRHIISIPNDGRFSNR